MNLTTTKGKTKLVLNVNEPPYIYDSDDIIYENSNIVAYIVYTGPQCAYAVWNKKHKINTHYFGLKKNLDNYLNKQRELTK